MATEEEFRTIEKVFSLGQLTDDQKTSINCVLNGGDVFLSTKTGSGKSMSYQAIPVVGKLRGKKWLVVVVTPLVSIMKEQTQNLQSLGIKGMYACQEYKSTIILFMNPTITLCGAVNHYQARQSLIRARQGGGGSCL
jgi:superfamily II DNA helicase RecQ